MQASMDEDLDKLPHVIITSDHIWDPTVLDHLIDIEIFTILLWIQILMKKILHHLMNAHLQLDPTYVMIAMVLAMVVMSTTNKSTALDLILMLRLVCLQLSVLFCLFLYFKSYFNTSQLFPPNYFSIISLSANLNPIRT